jgi:hypothetical protein
MSARTSTLPQSCGTCAIGAFDDQKIADVLGINGNEEFVLYCGAEGRKAKAGKLFHTSGRGDKI